MINFSDKTVYLACGCTDMRKSIDGLTAIVEGSFKLNPFDNAVFVFCNRHRDRIKILEWDGDGFWLYFKRLECGRFHWPKEDEAGSVMTLSAEEMSCLVDSARLEKKLRRQEVLERKTV